MNHLKLIIEREYLTKVRNKSFIIMTVLSPLIVIALMAVIAYLTKVNSDTKKTIAVLDQSGLITKTFQNTATITYQNLENINLETAKKLVKNEKNYGLLVINALKNNTKSTTTVQFFSENTPSPSLISAIENKIEKELTDLKLIEKGVDLEKIKNTKVNITISQENFEGKKTSKMDNLVKLIFGGAAGYLLFMFIIIYGNMIMRSVIEEKTSRIIEVIISSVKPTQLLFGKIIGTSLAGLTQFSIWIILGSLFFTIATTVFHIDLSGTPQQNIATLPLNNVSVPLQTQEFITAFMHLPITNLISAFILFFIGGYLLYSSLYAAIGSAVDNETDTQQFILPILIPLILAVYVGAFTVVEDPHGTISTIFSLIPFTSPVVMLMRIPFGVPIWQQIVALLLLIFTFIFVVWIAAKIYRIGILMYGKKPTYKELIKWINY